MNIVSTMVGLSIMGAAAPSMMTMSIAPFEAQKRAQNLGIAESAAVLYAAQNEGADTLSAWPNGCTVDRINTPAHTISCSHGENAYEQTIERSFRTAVPLTDGNTITFPMDPPESYTQWPCPGKDNILNWPVDAWGTSYYNQQTLGGQYCIPEAAQGGIDPDDDMSTWLWDLRVHFGG